MAERGTPNPAPLRAVGEHGIIGNVKPNGKNPLFDIWRSSEAGHGTIGHSGWQTPGFILLFEAAKRRCT
jgi:hypothetical protein